MSVDASAPQAAPGPRSPLRDPVVWAVLAAMCVSTMVYGIVVPFLPLRAELLGLSGVGTGALFAVYGLANLAMLLPLAGRAGRLPPAGLFAGALVVLVVSSTVFALAASSVPLLFVARALQGACAGTIWVVGPSVVAARYPPEARGHAMGVVTGGAALGTLIGPPVGGVLYAWGGWGLPFYGVAGLALLLLAPCVALLRGVEQAAAGPEAPRPLGTVLRDRAVRRVCVVVACGVSVLALLEPLLPLWLTGSFSTSVETNGLIFGGVVLAYALVTPAAGAWSDRVARLRVSAWGLFAIAVALCLTALAPSLVLTIPALLLVGAGLALALVPTNPAFADAMDAQSGGDALRTAATYVRVFVVYNLIYSAGLLVGPLVGGLLVDLVGQQASLALAGLAAGAVGLVTLWTRPEGSGP